MIDWRIKSPYPHGQGEQILNLMLNLRPTLGYNYSNKINMSSCGSNSVADASAVSLHSSYPQVYVSFSRLWSPTPPTL